MNNAEEKKLSFPTFNDIDSNNNRSSIDDSFRSIDLSIPFHVDGLTTILKKEAPSPFTTGMSTSLKKDGFEKYKESFQTFDTIRQVLSKEKFMIEQFEIFLQTLEAKLGIEAGPFDSVKDAIIKKVEELLQARLKTKNELEELKAQNDSYRNQIEVFNKNLEVELEKSKDFLKDHQYVFKKSTMVSVMKGVKLKKEELAHIEKILLDYKEKRVTIEYSFEPRDSDESTTQDSKEEEDNSFNTWNTSMNNMLKTTKRLVKKFITTNYFLLYNITDFYRFLKGKDAKNSFLTNVYSELEGLEKLLKNLNEDQDSKDSKEANNSRELNAAEIMNKFQQFMAELLGWFDRSFNPLKEQYQELSKSTRSFINDIRGRAEQTSKGRATSAVPNKDRSSK